jgi:DNA repair exonuclease SbcCD ATPase subunit
MATVKDLESHLEAEKNAKQEVIEQLEEVKATVVQRDITIKELKEKLDACPEAEEPYDGPTCSKCGSREVEKRASGYIQCLDTRCQYLDRCDDEEE